MLQRLELPPTADYHVHLRDGALMETVVPTIRKGGVDVVMVMPNLTPPVTTVKHAMDYRQKLQSLAPGVTFLMSLYLHQSITPETIAEAAKAGILNVKSYPAGVTTNSDSGVISYAQFYPVFAAMEEHDMILNLHGEMPSDSGSRKGAEASKLPAINILNAEEAFLPTLHDLHARFPRLRIVLEHCTSAAALAAVRACGPTVAATITAHHLFLTIDDAATDPFCFCKPVAKSEEDRVALLRAVVSGSPKFFFGSDSAPHSLAAKRGGSKGTSKTAAGCFTQGWATQLVVGAVEDAIEAGILDENDMAEDKLAGFLSVHGRAFYRAEGSKGREGRAIALEKKAETIDEFVTSPDGSVKIVPFRSGAESWSLTWL